MKSWQKALALALGLPSMMVGTFFMFQELVKLGIISQGTAQLVLVLVVLSILIKMIQVSRNKK